eukprot:comp19940_c0_seq1/m.24244 comp19940_c0_seq1/g.24244  ORF comp19940_c0_seq1/g.24244 comp19940_c0_seq1/m.24244 type:complete len:506 (-) comp19940_c0_seq1:126-1643(-)
MPEKVVPSVLPATKGSLKLKRIKATMGFLCTSAYKEVTARVLVVEHSFSDGWFCHDLNGQKITESEIEDMRVCIAKWLDSKPIEETTYPRQSLCDFYRNEGAEDKLGILKVWRTDPIPIVRVGKYMDYRLRPHETSPEALRGNYLLQIYDDGLLVRFPTEKDGNLVLEPFVDRPRMFAVVKENEQWGRLLNVANIADVNRLVYTKEMNDMLWVSEGLHEKKISAVADSLVSQYPAKRIVCIAGPSSSGKTTSAKRLSIQLRVNGYQALVIGMDDYFNDDTSGKVPVLPNGSLNYEALEAVDIDLLCERVHGLLRGEAVPHRHYDFYTHKGRDLEGQTIRMPSERSFVILEGIHGLNPRLHEALGGVEKVQRVYVSAITQLNIDSSRHVSTSDNRMLRRMLRDYRTRGYSAEQTMKRWPSVRQGEESYIFPYNEGADHIINTMLVYELPLLAHYCKPLLAEIVTEDPEMMEEVDRLMLLLSLFYPMHDEMVPLNSVMREFVGGGAF